MSWRKLGSEKYSRVDGVCVLACFLAVYYALALHVAAEFTQWKRLAEKRSVRNTAVCADLRKKRVFGLYCGMASTLYCRKASLIIVIMYRMLCACLLPRTFRVSLMVLIVGINSAISL